MNIYYLHIYENMHTQNQKRVTQMGSPGENEEGRPACSSVSSDQEPSVNSMHQHLELAELLFYSHFLLLKYI